MVGLILVFAVYLLLRFKLGIFGIDFALGRMPLEYILLPVGVLGMLSASLVAIYQVEIKRLLAYSSVAQIGYMVLGLSLVSVAGLTGGIVHLFNHALMKSGLFLVMACVLVRVGSTRIESFAGLGRRTGPMTRDRRNARVRASLQSPRRGPRGYSPRD